MLVSDSSRLSRFTQAQDPVWDDVMNELRAGQKRTHWMWFVFPQLRELGMSEKSKFFGLSGLREARAYARHEVLGSRLLKAADALTLSVQGPIEEALGEVDALKLRSCATLFALSTENRIWGDVLQSFFNGSSDVQTLLLVQGEKGLSRLADVSSSC